MQTTVTETGPARYQRIHNHLDQAFLKYRFLDCPLTNSLNVLGKKWTFQILHEIGFYRIDRFNRLKESIQGIAPRVLATRLKQLEMLGLIERVETKKSPMMVRWALTPKGKDALPTLMMLIAFASKWRADAVFEDKKSRKLSELFDNEGLNLIYGTI